MSRRPAGPLVRLARWAACGLLGVAALPATAAAAASEPSALAPRVSAGAQTAADPAYDVLVFSRTAGFRHSSIDEGVTALRELGAANNFTVTATEDPAAFTPSNLAGYEAVVFLSTTGDVLDPTQQTAFEGYMAAGGGYVGVHAAADTEYDWSWYAGLAGALFQSHPAVQPARIEVEDRAHDATAHLGPAWQRTDEWYDYRTNPRTSAHVLASLDETSYSGGSMGGDHPIAWCKDYAGGRAFYTGGGHTEESYGDPAFRRHLLGGIRWAAELTEADCRPETGYTPLYGTSGTTGWKQAGPGSFAESDATLTSRGGLGLLWYQAKEYSAYSLKLDWRQAGDDNSGVFVGFPASEDPWSAVDHGYEIQIDATDTPDRTTGSVYGFKSADLPARDAALNPPGSGTPTSYGSRANASRCSSTATGSTTSATPTPPVASSRATSAFRTTETVTTCPSGTSGSRNWAFPPAPGRARSQGSAASAWMWQGPRRRTGHRSSCTRATGRRRRGGRSPRTGHCGRWASAWTSAVVARRTAPRCSSTDATGPGRRHGHPGLTGRCGTRSPESVSTRRACPRRTVPGSTCGRAAPEPTRNGSSPAE